VTTVATQALYFMNNPFVAHRARAVSEATSPWKEDPLARVSEIYLRVLGREPDGEETDKALAFVREGAEGGTPGAEDAWALFVQALFASGEFRYLQ
jgi:hypothetical protein